MSKGLLKNTKFKSEIKNFYKENHNLILDIILFGSNVRGKDKPNDIDILIIFIDKKDYDLSYKLKKTLEKKGFHTEITDKTYKEIFNTDFKARESILSEGYSIINDTFLSSGLGYSRLILFKYELGKMNKSDRMRFYYSLYGRKKNDKGVLDRYKSKKFSESIIICPVENSESLKNFFEEWKIKYISFPIIIPERIENII